MNIWNHHRKETFFETQTQQLVIVTLDIQAPKLRFGMTGASTKRQLQHHMNFEGINDFVYLDSMKCFAQIHLPTDCWIYHSWTASYLTHLWFAAEKNMVQRMKEDERPMKCNSGHAMDDPLEKSLYSIHIQKGSKKGFIRPAF